jgi:hypothetical protein
MSGKGIDVLTVLSKHHERFALALSVAEFDEMVAARAAVRELIEWRRQAVPLLKAAASWMPTRKCAAHRREIDALLANIGAATP